jgi:hypothetical protein
MMETITLKEATILLKYKDVRSTVNFCISNNVKIYQINGGRRYVFKAEFEQARLKMFMLHLKLKYKENWSSAFEAHMKMDILSIVKIEQGISFSNRKVKERYKPKSEHAKRFLQD